MQSNVAEANRVAALNGLGLVVLATYVVRRDIEKGKLKTVLQDYALPPLDIHAVYPHRKYLSAKVRCFLDFYSNGWNHACQFHIREKLK